MRSALADPAKRTFEAADAPAPAPGGIAARALAARAGAGGYLDDLKRWGPVVKASGFVAVD